MQLSRIQAKNFRCFEELDWSLPNEGGNGFHLLMGDNQENTNLGSNGAGKTTLFDAICWALFDKTSTGLKAGRLLKRGSTGGYSVTLTLTGFDHQLPYVIKRTWKPNSLTCCGEPWTEEQLQNFLGVSFEQFLYSVYFTQFGTQFIDLSPTEKLNFLSAIFKLDLWLDCADICRDDIKESAIRRDGTQSQIDQLNQIIESKFQNIGQLQASKLEWQENNSKEIEAAKAKAADLATQLKPEIDLTEILTMSRQCSDEVSVVEAKLNQSRLNLRKIDTKIAGIAALCKDLTTRGEKLTNDAAENKVCPSCGQPVTTDNLEQCIEELLKEFDEKQAGILPLEIEQHAQTTEIEHLETQLIELRKNMAAVQEVQSEMRQQAVIRNSLLQQIDSHTKAAASLEGARNPYDQQIKVLEDQIDLDRHNLAIQSQKLQEQDTAIAHLEMWLKWFPELRLDILNDLITELEITLNQAFQAMGLHDWTVTVHTERQLVSKATKRELNLKVVTSTGEEIDLDTLSGGERQRVKIAVAVGIADLIKAQTSDWNLQMWDEPTKNLSTEGVDDLLDFFATLATGNLVLLADHKVLSTGCFDSVIEIVKDQSGNSTITGSKQLCESKL